MSLALAAALALSASPPAGQAVPSQPALVPVKTLKKLEPAPLTVQPNAQLQANTPDAGTAPAAAKPTTGKRPKPTAKQLAAPKAAK